MSTGLTPRLKGLNTPALPATLHLDSAVQSPGRAESRCNREASDGQHRTSGSALSGDCDEVSEGCRTDHLRKSHRGVEAAHLLPQPKTPRLEEGEVSAGSSARMSARDDGADSADDEKQALSRAEGARMEAVNEAESAEKADAGEGEENEREEGEREESDDEESDEEESDEDDFLQMMVQKEQRSKAATTPARSSRTTPRTTTPSSGGRGTAAAGSAAAEAVTPTPLTTVGEAEDGWESMSKPRRTRTPRSISADTPTTPAAVASAPALEYDDHDDDWDTGFDAVKSGARRARGKHGNNLKQQVCRSYAIQARASQRAAATNR
uniref:Uncharacterized protein n=1 Tax=Chrysotila carterae TaxID=13221 RepID=A0A7S4C4S8_CHRCT|mmetsp:Transcript_53672/g.117045  ORF Transcript_53672/g.117045 Transcript_53672/m.117045 type:complete len:323 (+) Transcript_53672:376-1344(+)|eukprot:5387862-Pleurochrysis_carterae.AAC.2